MQTEKVSKLIEHFFQNGGKTDSDIIPMLGKQMAYLTAIELDSLVSAILLRIEPFKKEEFLAQAA